MGPTQEKVLFLTEEMGGRDWLSLSLCDSAQFTDHPVAGEGRSPLLGLGWISSLFLLSIAVQLFQYLVA